MIHKVIPIKYFLISFFPIFQYSQSKYLKVQLFWPYCIVEKALFLDPGYKWFTANELNHFGVFMKAL